MSNPAMNPKIYERETAAANNDGAFTPGWGSPADELPPGVFGNQTGAAAPGTVPPAAGRPGMGGPTGRPPVAAGSGDTMRMSGTMTAAGILLLLLMVAGWFGWSAVTVTSTVNIDGSKSFSYDMPPWLFLSWIAGFGIAIVTIFKPKIARITAPLYSVAEGLLLGAISAIFEAQFPGIVVQAVLLTFGVFIMMLVLFATGTVKVTNRLRTGIIAATGAIALVYLLSIVVSLFGGNVPIINDASPIGIGFSLLVVGVASMNLLLDFDFIQKAVDYKAPRYMEWFGAFALMLTLVWLYLEILRLLAKLRSR
jgi:uncharacterized YccA/Bax inhibitor family protein